MSKDIIFHGCHTGLDFENTVISVLEDAGIQASRTGKSDGGIDILAVKGGYSFNIQCKYYNKPLGKTPIQEVYAGTHYYNNGASPVVITNNRVTADARVYAKRLGVEIIAEGEWQEIKQVFLAKRRISPNPHTGLMELILSHITGEESCEAVPVVKPTVREELKLEIISNFDTAAEYVKEAARLQQSAAKYQQMALTLQKEALLRNLDYG